MRSKLVGRLLSFTLSATVALTSGIPALAYDGGGGLPEDDEEILVLDDENEELGSDFDAQEEIVEASEEFFEIEDDAEFDSSEGGVITITDSAANADFYRVNGGIATKVNDGTFTIPTEQDGVIYIVPKAGYDWATSVAPVTLAGRYTDKSGVVHNIADASSVTSVLSEYDVTDNPVSAITLQENLTADSLYWNKARMVTINSSFLEGFENKGTAAEGYADVTISITAVDPTVVSYDLPIYVYDGISDSATYQKYSQVTRMTTPKLTYGTGVTAGTAIDINNAMTTADWENYTWNVKLSMLNSDLSGDTGTLFAGYDNSTDWGNDTNSDAKYFYDASSKKISINALSTQTGYLENEKSLGTKKFAIILTKTAKAAAATEYDLFAKDTDYVDFSFTDSEKALIPAQKITDDDFTGIKVENTAAEAGTSVSKIGAVVKNYADTTATGEATDVTLPEGGKPARTLPGATGSVLFTMGTDEPVAGTFSTDNWAIPTAMVTPTADVEITAQTNETVVIATNSVDTAAGVTVNYVEKNGVANTGAIAVTSNSNKGLSISDINTGSDLKFSVYPKAGWKVNGVTITRYSVDGSSVAMRNVTVPAVDNVYTVENITGFAQITINAEEVSSTILVKKDAADAANVTLTDIATNLPIDTAGGLFAAENKEYIFKAEADAGYSIKEITAKAGSETVAVTSYDSTANTYRIASVTAGPLVIKPVQEEAVAVYKFTNADAEVTIDSKEITQTAYATIAADSSVSFTVTPKNDAKVTGVYYTTTAPGASLDTHAELKALVEAGTAAWKLSSTGTTYTISSGNIKEIAKSNRAIYIIATTERDAKQGLDYESVKIFDSTAGTPNDITSGLTLWAADGTDATSIALGDLAAERTVVAKWTDKEGVVTTSPAATSGTDVVSYTLAKTTGDSDTDTRIAVFDATTKNLILPTKYNGGEASSDSDVLSIKYKTVDAAGAEVKFPATVTYKADLTVTVKPLRDYYETYELVPDTATATLAPIIGEKKMRIDDGTISDTYALEVHGKRAKTATTAAVDNTLAMSTAPVIATTGIEFTTTPKMKSAVTNAEYKLNSSTVTNKVNANKATISVAKKLQTIGVSAVVTFSDGTKATATDSVEVIATNYGYYAVPTVTVNGTETKIDGTTNTAIVNIETAAGGIQTGKVKYDVYHALDNTGKTLFTAFDTNNVTAAQIATAVAQGHIEKVDASAITWTSLEGPTGYAKNFSVSGSNGDYTITAVAKNTAAQTLTLSAKATADGFKVEMPQNVAISVKVATVLEKQNLSITTNDSTGRHSEVETDKYDYRYPVLSWNIGYKQSEILTSTNQTGTMLLGVPVGTKLTLPGAEVFTNVDPLRTLAGWKDGSTYYKIGDAYTTTSTSELTAIWAYKYSNAAGAYNASNAGKILAVNAKTEAEVANPLRISVGESVQVIAGYYPLDITKVITTSDTGVTYSSDIVLVKDTSKLALTTTEVAEGKTFLGAGDEGVFANSTVRGVEKTSSNISAKLTYTEGTNAKYDVAIAGIAVIDAEVWEIAAADVTVENGQTTTKALTTLKKGTSAEDLANTNFTAEGVTPTFTYSDDSIALVTLSAPGTNTLSIKGLKVGSTQVTMKMVSAGNVEKSVNFNVTVTKAEVQIIVKVKPNYATPNKTIESVTVAEGEPIKLYNGSVGNIVDISLKDKDGADIETSNVTFTATAFAADKDDDTVDAAVTATNDTTASQTWTVTSNAFGVYTAQIKVTLKGDGRVYTRDLDIVTYGAVAVHGPKSNVNITVDAAKAETALFDVYEGTQVDDNAFADKTIAYVPVVYDKTKAPTDKYTVSLADFSVKWKYAAVAQQFLGWGDSKANINQDASTFEAYGYKGALAGETLSLAAADVASGVSVYAYFSAVPISTVVLPEVIRLSDEDVDGDIASTDTRKTKDGTDWEEYNIIVSPVTSTEVLTVSASEAGLFDIASVGQTGTASDYGKDTSAQNLYTASGTAWDGSKVLALHIGGDTTIRTDNFRIGKIAGKVGKAELYFESATKAYDPVPVYINGEYTDTTVTPNKTRYMEDGEILKEGARTVDGIIHYYKDSEQITDGAVTLEVDGVKKLVLIVGGVKVTTPKNGTRTVNGKTYYIGEDGYLKTGVVTIDGKDYLFREDGSKVSHTDEDVKDGIFTFGDVDYVVANDDTVEEDKLFEVSGTPTWTWTKASDGKTFASAKVVFTSTDGRTKEITVPVANMTVTTEGELTKYVATASFTTKGTEVTATDTKYLDADGNEVIPHDHVWTPEWKWTAVEDNIEQKVAVLTLTCKVDAENPHTETLSKTVTAEKNGLVWSWNASFEYDGKTYTAPEQTEVRDEETGEEIEVEDISGGKGIVITLYRDEYNYTGSPIKPTDFSVLDLERSGDYYLNPGTEYSVSYKNNTKVGTAEIIIKGKGNYAGKATSAKFKIVNPYPDDAEAPVVKGATLKLPKATYTFNNEEQFPATVEFGLKGQTAKTYTFDGGSYVDSEGNPLPAAWTCENNRNAGTATFAVLGVKDSKGQPTAVKKTFKIQAATLDTTNYKVLVGGQEKDFEIEWFAKGATPWVDIAWTNGDNEYGLWSGKDFTVSYADNKKVGTATVTIKGKGNFKGTLKKVATFKINALDLGETWLQADTAKAGMKGKQVKVTVVDHYNNVIPAAKYTVSVTDAESGADLTNTKLTAGMNIVIKAVAKDSTAVTGETAERPVTIAADFSKAKVKVPSSFYKEYTGNAIEADDLADDMKNITVTIKVGKETKTLVYGEDYFIAGTANNINKGTMTVTIIGNAEEDTERGIPAFSGSKTFKVKIKARQLPLK